MQVRNGGSEVKKHNADIVGIGAGPNGLMIAIQLAEFRKDIKLALIEKHSEPLRKQRLRVDLNNITSPRILTSLKKMVAEGKAKKHDDHQILIPIKILETCLRQHAQELGIEIIPQQFLSQKQYKQQLSEHKVSNQTELEAKLQQKVIVDMEQLAEQFPNCNMLIGADGSRSNVRDLVVGDEKLSQNDLRYMVEFKYEVKGKVEPLPAIQFTLIQPLLNGFLCSEHIKYNGEEKNSGADEKEKTSNVEDEKKSDKNNTTEVTLNFLVDRETYDDPLLKDVKASNLLPLSPQIPEKLKEAINLWVKGRFNDKNIVFGSPTLNKTKLSIYTSNSHSKEISHMPVVLAGDAACGFPFMNGLNLGINNGNYLVELIVRYWDKIKNKDEAAIHKLMEEHAKHTQETFNVGTKIVAKKDHQIKQQKTMVDIIHYSSLVPSAIIKSIQAPLHKVFFAHDPFNFKKLEEYIKHAKNDKKALAENLLNILKEMNLRSGDAIAEVDFELARGVLHQAYLENLALEKATSHPSAVFLSIFKTKHRDEKEAKTDESNVVPEKIQYSSNLHHIIYTMYKRLCDYYERFNSKLENAASTEGKRLSKKLA